MILDAQNQFSDSQAITAAAKSTNIIDLGTERRIGTGENLYIVLQVTVAFTDAGSDSTVTATLESDSVEAMSSPTARQVIGTFGALSAAGTRLIARIAPEILNERFLQIDYALANGDLTTGSIDAFIVHDIDAFTAYPKGFVVTS